MKLSEYIEQGTFIIRDAKLLCDISLENGETRKKGDTVSILMKNKDGTYHAEDNDWACKLKRNEFEFIE